VIGFSLEVLLRPTYVWFGTLLDMTLNCVLKQGNPRKCAKQEREQYQLSNW